MASSSSGYKPPKGFAETVLRRRAEAAADASGNKGAALGFSAKALATTLGGAALTILIAAAQSWYSDRLEAQRRQQESGVQLQSEVLAVTGMFENELNSIVGLVRTGGAQNLNAAKNRLDAFDGLFNDLRSRRLFLRNRAAQIWGRGVGDLVYNYSEGSFDLDRCNVVIRTGDPARDSNCTLRRRGEIENLERLRADAQGDMGLRAFARNERSPISVYANIKIMGDLLRSYISCAIAAPAPPAATLPRPPAPASLPVPPAAVAAPAARSVTSAPPADPEPRCRNPRDSYLIIIRRNDLLAIARENLAAEIMASSIVSN